MATTPKKRTVLLVAPWALSILGGVSEVLHNLLRLASRENDLQPLLLVPDWSQAVPSWRRTNDVDEVHLRWVAPWDAERPLHHLVRLPFRAPLAFLRLVRLLRQLRPAVINMHFPDLASLTIVRAARIVRPAVRIVLSFHGSDVQSIESASGIEGWWWRRLLNSVDAITCCSDNLRERLLAAAGPLPEVLVTHNGVDAQRLQDEVSAGAVPAELRGRRYMASVAKFEEKKGLDILVRSFAEIHVAQPDLILALIGAHGPALEDIRALVTRLELDGAVFLGVNFPHADALAIIRGAEVLVLSSRQEPFGIVLLEAASFTVPVVATTVGGIPEVVVNGVTGTLVSPENVAELATALRVVLENPATARALAASARTHALKDFSWEAAFVRYRSILLPEDPSRRPRP